MTDDATARRRELADDMERKALWLRRLSAHANADGFITEEGARQAAVEAGIGTPKPPEPDPEAIATKLGELADDDGRVTVDQAVGAISGEPAPPGEGGAVERGSPPPAGSALDARIREAERAGDHHLAIALKNQKLLRIHERMEGNQ